MYQHWFTDFNERTTPKQDVNTNKIGTTNNGNLQTNPKVFFIIPSIMPFHAIILIFSYLSDPKAGFLFSPY